MALANSKGIDTKSIKQAIKKSMKQARDKRMGKKIEKNDVELSDGTIEKISNNLYKKLQETISADDVVKKTKVETPTDKGGVKNKYSNRKINLAIRQLVEEKRKKLINNK